MVKEGQMAKTMYAIEIDFANAVRQADELDRVAQDLSTLVDRQFHPCLQGISASWRGENATAFCRKGNAIGQNIARSVSDLRNAAETIRKIAQNIYNAEKTNYEIAQMRSY